VLPIFFSPLIAGFRKERYQKKQCPYIYSPPEAGFRKER
jgi:hypothetical protein